VTITDTAGHTCLAYENGGYQTCDTLELFSTLTLEAKGDTPTWNQEDCDVLPGGTSTTSTCRSILLGTQNFNVGFGVGVPVPTNSPPQVKVIFRARKTGSGSGTIRGELDCGSRCSVTVPFRKSVTLVADADAGSRFVRWRGGCGTAATCTLQATATSVAAEFATVSRPPTGPGSSPPTHPGSSPPTHPSSPRPAGGRFKARIGKITTTGHGRHRLIRIPVTVNAPASVRAKLLKGRRQVATKSFSLRTGTSRLRLTVPSRSRAGRYRLKLRIRDRAGTSSPVSVARTVRLRR
jgi:hypothetical protein